MHKEKIKFFGSNNEIQQKEFFGEFKSNFTSQNNEKNKSLNNTEQNFNKKLDQMKEGKYSNNQNYNNKYDEKIINCSVFAAGAHLYD